MPGAFTDIICPLQLIADTNTFPVLAERLAVVTGLPQDTILADLADVSFCAEYTAARRPSQTVATAAPTPLALAPDGFPVSAKNPLWNLCVRGIPVTRREVLENPDAETLRSGYVIHRSCDYYRTAGSNDWKFPDDPFVTFTVKPNAAGKPTVTVSTGYVLVEKKPDAQ